MAIRRPPTRKLAYSCRERPPERAHRERGSHIDTAKEAGAHGGWGQKHLSSLSLPAHSLPMVEKHLEYCLGARASCPTRRHSIWTALGVSAEPL